MKIREFIFYALLLVVPLIIGPLLAYYTSYAGLEWIGIDLSAKATMTSAVMLIAGLVTWYALWIILGFYLALIMARPIAPTGAISKLESIGMLTIPVLSDIYTYIVERLYRNNR